jgi:predicted acyl esterase
MPSDKPSGEAVFVPATPYDESKEKGRFSRFAPGTRTLPAGFCLGEPYAPLATDNVFDKDVAVTLRDGVRIFVDVFRPAGVEQVPVLVAWSPYGKSRGRHPVGHRGAQAPGYRPAPALAGPFTGPDLATAGLHQGRQSSDATSSSA